jgi:hypothetical protein
VATEEPVVGTHVALRDDAATRPLARDLDDAVDHEERRQRQARGEPRRRVRDQRPLRERQQLRLVEAAPGLELGERHCAGPSKRSR